MMNFKTLLLAILLTANCAYAQKSQITGVSNDWKGREVRVLADADPISGVYNELAQTTIDDAGKFSINVPVDEIRMVWLAVNRFKAPLYVKSGINYELQIGGTEENPYIDTWNKGELAYTFNYLADDDPNKAIMEFDNAYYQFFLDHSELIGKSTMKSKISEFEKEWSTRYAKQPYLNTYIKYSIAEMKLSAGFPKQELFETYLINVSGSEDNPGFRDFFNTFYADYLERYNSRVKGVDIKSTLNEKPDLDAFFTHIRKDPFANDAVIISQMVVLKAITEVYGDPDYSKNALKQVLNRVSTMAKTNYLENIAENIRNKWQMKEGSITIKDIKAAYAPGLNFKPGTSNLLVITNTESNASKRELHLLTDLSAEYNSEFWVTECTVGNLEGDKKKASWPKTTAEDAYGLLEALDVYSFPHFVWVDSRGNVTESGIEPPSQGLERRLHQLKVKSEVKSKIKVGQ